MSLLKKLAGLAVGAAAVGAVAYVLQNREHHDDEYEHIWPAKYFLFSLIIQAYVEKSI